jgi:small subunit ribosomal protein S3
LLKDIEVKQHLFSQLNHASVSRIEIERTEDNARVLIHTARPGVVIGKRGEDIDRMREEITLMMGIPVTLSIQEIRKPDLDAKLLADNVAQQLERRVMFRRAMKRAIQNAMRQGAQGVKIRVAGRLGGAEIARAEWHKEGRVPLHTLRADIDYGQSEAKTTYGIIGVKAWVFRGEILDKKAKEKKEK